MRKKAPVISGLALAGMILLYLISPGTFRLNDQDIVPAAVDKPAVTEVSGTDNIVVVEASGNITASEATGTAVEIGRDDTKGKPAATEAAGNDNTAAAEASGNTTTSEPSGRTSADNTVKAPAAADSPIKVTDTEGIVPHGTITAHIKRIVDGDTLVAVYKNKDYRVRLLCIDTPESVKTGVKAQPYGKEASEKLKALVLDKEVSLVFEKDTDDRYDRLLAYLLLEDGTCVNALMVSEGYARVEFVKPNTVNREYFEGLMEEAISRGRGLWSLPEDEVPFVKDKDGDYYPRYYDEEKAA
ncbi:MAG TPA: thermonuclease family protein [Clostridia bacterium]|nr:thermonuclease family protein [Clostridia bacterium]